MDREMKIIKEGLKKQGLRCKYCGNFLWLYWDRKNLKRISGAIIVREEEIGNYVIQCLDCDSLLRVKK